LDDALRVVERTGERWFSAELNRHKGQLLLQQGHSEAAEGLYHAALNLARQQGAKLWELRAAASLACLRRDQGRHQEARDLLAPIYGCSPRVSACPISKKQRRCSTSCDELIAGAMKCRGRRAVCAQPC
jgi:predicted ATPase